MGRDWLGWLGLGLAGFSLGFRMDFGLISVGFPLGYGFGLIWLDSGLVRFGFGLILVGFG